MGVFEGKETVTDRLILGTGSEETVKDEGLWKKNKRHGRGVMTEPGQWDHDVRQGAGTCKLLNTDAWVGTGSVTRFMAKVS